MDHNWNISVARTGAPAFRQCQPGTLILVRQELIHDDLFAALAHHLSLVQPKPPTDPQVGGREHRLLLSSTETSIRFRDRQGY